MSRLTAWERWQAAAGPWRGWVICPALTMPSGVESSDVALDKAPWIKPLPTVEEALRDGTALILNLEPVLGVRIAAEVSRQRLAHVVLVLPRWPHADAVLPTRELIATLVGVSPRLRAAESGASVVFVLDAEREASVGRPPGDARVDNRYALSVGDLPNLATLRAAGIQRLLKVTPKR